MKFTNIILHCIIFSILSHNGGKPLPLYPTMEENLFHCIPQWKKTSSIVSHNRGKPLPLYPTMEENLFHCGIQRKKTCIVMGYNAEYFSVLYTLMQKNSIVLSYSSVLLYLKSKKKMLLSGVGYSAEKASMLWDTVHRIRFCCGVGYNRRKTPVLWNTTEKTTSIISHYKTKTLVLWDTMEKICKPS